MSAKRKWKNPGCRTEFHGLYQSWLDLRNRCGNRVGNRPTYSDVELCERWLSYDNFFEDMSSTWFKGATIDKDSIKPGNRVYCKEYCQWMSRSENAKERVQRLGSPMKGKFGAEHNRSKRVKCIETGEIFGSCAEATRKYHSGKDSISNAANPNKTNKTAAGYHWEYV